MKNIFELGVLFLGVMILVISLNNIYAGNSENVDVGVNVSNALPQILDVNICESGVCSKYLGNITPGASSFYLQINAYDPNGYSDINWAATQIHIFKSDFSLDTNEEFDGNIDYKKLTLNTTPLPLGEGDSYNGFIEEDGQGCVSNQDFTEEINCYLVNEDVFTAGFAVGGANVYIKIFDINGESATYLLNYLADTNGLNIIQTLDFSLSVDDMYGIVYSGATGDENVPFFNYETDSNYISIVNESNVSVDLNFSHTNLVDDSNVDNIIDKKYIHADNSKDINFESGSVIGGSLDRQEGMNLRTVLDIPEGTHSGSYSGTMGIGISAN